MKKYAFHAVCAFGAIASVWVGAWLTLSVYSYGDWQHFPALFTSAITFFAFCSGFINLMVDGSN